MNGESEAIRSKNKPITLDNVLRAVCTGMGWPASVNAGKELISKREFIKIMILSDITFDRNKCISLLKNLQDIDLITPTKLADRYFMDMKALHDRLGITETTEA